MYPGGSYIYPGAHLCFLKILPRGWENTAPQKLLWGWRIFFCSKVANVPTGTDRHMRAVWLFALLFARASTRVCVILIIYFSCMYLFFSCCSCCYFSNDVCVWNFVLVFCCCCLSLLLFVVVVVHCFYYFCCFWNHYYLHFLCSSFYYHVLLFVFVFNVCLWSCRRNNYMSWLNTCLCLCLCLCLILVCW